MRHPDAAEALQIMGRAEPTNWIDLYKVYEIIREAKGGEAGLIRSGLATKPDISAFTGIAHHRKRVVGVLLSGPRPLISHDGRTVLAVSIPQVRGHRGLPGAK